MCSYMIDMLLVFFASAESFCANAVDASQPIDILFYGSSNPHRERLKQIFDELAALLDLRVEFHLDYGAFDLERDSLVERSKVCQIWSHTATAGDLPLACLISRSCYFHNQIVLNLGNTDWPPSSEDQSAHANNSYCNIDIGVEPLGTPVNWHRIKGLLARGKVVVSEARNDVPLSMYLYVYTPIECVPFSLFVYCVRTCRGLEVRWTRSCLVRLSCSQTPLL